MQNAVESQESQDHSQSAITHRKCHYRCASFKCSHFQKSFNKISQLHIIVHLYFNGAISQHPILEHVTKELSKLNVHSINVSLKHVKFIIKLKSTLPLPLVSFKLITKFQCASTCIRINENYVKSICLNDRQQKVLLLD